MFPVALVALLSLLFFCSVPVVANSYTTSIEEGEIATKIINVEPTVAPIQTFDGGDSSSSGDGVECWVTSESEHNDYYLGYEFQTNYKCSDGTRFVSVLTPSFHFHPPTLLIPHRQEAPRVPPSSAL